MNNLPPPLARLAAVIAAEPGPEQAAFRYCLALAMVEAGQARLVEAGAEAAGNLVTFETTTGERFTLPNPGLNPDDEAVIKQMVRHILDQESKP